LLLCTLAVPRAQAFGSLDGYAGATSIAAGDTIGLHVAGDCGSVLLRFYRHTFDKELLMDVDGLVPPNLPVPDSAWIKGCNWPTLYTLQVPSYWPSGMYYVEMVPSDGGPLKYISFVVRSNGPPKPILVISAVNTYQAYNPFGGKSLYDFNSPGGRAPRVTFNRPYDSHAGLGQPQFEVPFVKWFDRAGFSADFATDVDLSENPTLLHGHRLLLIVGHNEYWSRNMFNFTQTFADTGGNIAVLGGNTCYWQVRYEDAGRTLVCYKSTDDPMFHVNFEQTTVQWRDRWVRRPECLLFGVMYPYCAGTAQDSMVFTHTYSWITEGLEDQVGRKFGDKVVGYEYDTFFDDRSPAKAVRLFQTPFNDVEGCPQTQCATYYERQSAFDQFGVGGGIFAAGSIQWSWGLEESEVGTKPDPRMQLLTSNLLKGLSQILRVKQYGMTVVRARVTGPYAIPHMPIFLEPVHVGPDTTSLGTFAMMDDGQYPDLAEGDGIYATQFPLYPDERMPLKLKWSTTGSQEIASVRQPTDWLWLENMAYDSEAEQYTRGLDTLYVDDDLIGVPVPEPRTEFRLMPTPNPFGGRITLTWGAGNAVKTVDVHDARGRLVATIPVEQGAAAATWNGRDDRGHPAPAGIYWARAMGERGTRVARIVKL